jgi:hypothetical protein
MGIRLHLFAVDEPGFAHLLERTTGEVLAFLAERATERVPFRVNDPDGPFFHTVVPGKGVATYMFRENKGVRLLRDQQRVARPSGAVLSTRMLDHLRGQRSASDLLFLLRALASARSVDFVRRVTSDCQPFWIGSFLEAAIRFDHLYGRDSRPSSTSSARSSVAILASRGCRAGSSWATHPRLPPTRFASCPTTMAT